LAFKTWRTHQIPLITEPIRDFSREEDAFFREAYMGAIVDVYRPVIENGYYYDVNSLYPSAMMEDNASR
jgi:hypothetical protein